mmetsp:Transcript_65704/g.144102  ORF Transcript_65704/g.144102 Transcript_65704/m.144102 type:complete len:228 (+) Transcript_65704:91-774(+)
MVIRSRRKQAIAIPTDRIHRLGVATKAAHEAAMPPVPNVNTMVLPATRNKVAVRPLFGKDQERAFLGREREVAIENRQHIHRSGIQQQQLHSGGQVGCWPYQKVLKGISLGDSSTSTFRCVWPGVQQDEVPRSIPLGAQYHTLAHGVNLDSHVVDLRQGRRHLSFWKSFKAVPPSLKRIQIHQTDFIAEVRHAARHRQDLTRAATLSRGSHLQAVKIIHFAFKAQPR